MTTDHQPRTVVLLVEDHADSRLMYAEFLKMQFTVFDAPDGVAAIELMEGVAPDVMVTDLSLPRMDGFELIRRTRADPRLARVAIIALSGYSSPDHEASARAAGAEVVLHKPCLPDQLADAVVALASRRKDVG
jgi:CheY-like chemotaxis protein